MLVRFFHRHTAIVSIAALAAACALMAPRPALAATANYSAEYKDLANGYDVTALAVFDPATGAMTVTLSNLVANSPDAVHAISALPEFQLS